MRSVVQRVKDIYDIYGGTVKKKPPTATATRVYRLANNLGLHKQVAPRQSVLLI